MSRFEAKIHYGNWRSHNAVIAQSFDTESAARLWIEQQLPRLVCPQATITDTQTGRAEVYSDVGFIEPLYTLEDWRQESWV